MKKRVLSLLLASVMLLTCFTGCGKKENDSDKNDGQDQVVQNSQQESQMDSQVGTDSEAESEKEELPNPNGKGFSMSQKCLDDYLNFVASGNAYKMYAEEDIKENQITEEMWEEKGERFKYFSIAGMHDGEPLLLLSSTNVTNECGDETYFIVYRPDTGEYVPGIEMLGNFKITSYDYMWRMGVYNTSLYVCTSEWVSDAQFIYHETTGYIDPDTGEEHKSETAYTIERKEAKDFGCVEETYTKNNCESWLKKGRLAEIKWFSAEQVEEARAYYQPYVRTYEGPQDIANRADYFNDSTVLKYYEYFDDGVMEVKEENGQTKFVFSCLNEDKAGDLAFNKIPNSIQLMGGSDHTSVVYDIIVKEDGSWTAIRKEMWKEEFGYVVTVVEETDEEKIVSFYRYQHWSPGEVSSIEELIQMERQKEQ